VLGEAPSTASDSSGVKGKGGSCGFCMGVYGTVPGNGIGVRGEALSGNGWGLQGIGGPSGVGVLASTPAASTLSYGMKGTSGSSAPNPGRADGGIHHPP